VKSEEKAYADLVKTVMGALTQAEETEQIDCGSIATVAIDIVGKIRESAWLVFDGDVREVQGMVWRMRDKGEPGVTWYQVPVRGEGSSDPECSWCRKQYWTGQDSYKHRICSSCYAGGPPEE
jgi:hypothetical protein